MDIGIEKNNAQITKRSFLDVPINTVILGLLMLFAVIPMVTLLCFCIVWIIIDRFYITSGNYDVQSRDIEFVHD